MLGIFLFSTAAACTAAVVAALCPLPGHNVVEQHAGPHAGNSHSVRGEKGRVQYATGWESSDTNSRPTEWVELWITLPMRREMYAYVTLNDTGPLPPRLQPSRRSEPPTCCDFAPRTRLPTTAFSQK